MKNIFAVVFAIFVLVVNTSSLFAASTALDGVDYGIIKSATILFQDSRTSSSQIGPLSRGAIVVLVSRDLSNGFLNVIKLSTGRAGWVRLNRVRIHYTNHHNHEIELPSDSSGSGTGDPSVDVKNNSDSDLYLHISSLPEIDVPAYGEKIVTVVSGVHAFNVSMPNVVPEFGHRAFIDGEVYSWTWSIVDHATLHDHRATSEQIVKFNQDESNVKLEQQEVDNDAALLTTEKSSVDEQASKIQADQADVDSRRATLDNTDQSAVDSFNSLVDATNQELNNYHVALASYNSQVDDYNAKLAKLRADRAELEAESDKINNH